MERNMYNCESCKMTFNRRERLEKHIKKGCNRTTCKTCNKKFTDVGRLRQHERLHITRASQRDCGTCGKTFQLAEYLRNHQKNADPIDCDVCDTTFCHKSEMERHKRTEHIGEGIDKVEDLNLPICPRSGYEDTEEYREEVYAHMSKIRDSRDEDDVHLFLNKQITPDFTYEDLKDMLYEIIENRGTAFKVNLGFGFILYHLVKREYKYFYVSSNTLLLDVAFTVSKKTDADKLMKHIIDLDLKTNYYMKRPSSGWMLVGMPNLELKIFYLNGVPLGL